jgi:hypothetical protein
MCSSQCVSPPEVIYIDLHPVTLEYLVYFEARQLFALNIVHQILATDCKPLRKPFAGIAHMGK